MDNTTICNYLTDLIEAQFIEKDEAIYFAEEFYNQQKITEEQYNNLLKLIEETYQRVFFYCL